MKLLSYEKDGGPESKSWGLFLVEIKSLFSVVLLHFHPGARDAYHSHAFHAVSWVLRGKLVENMLDGKVNTYTPGIRPVVTLRSSFHKVVSVGDTWAITFRGPWISRWREFLPVKGKFITLTHGRKVVE